MTWVGVFDGRASPSHVIPSLAEQGEESSVPPESRFASNQKPPIHEDGGLRGTTSFHPVWGALHGPEPQGQRCIGRPRAVLLALSVVEGRSSASDRATFGGSRCGGSQPQAAPSLISGPGLLFPVQGLMRLCLNSNRTRKPRQEGQWSVVSEKNGIHRPLTTGFMGCARPPVCPHPTPPPRSHQAGRESVEPLPMD